MQSPDLTQSPLQYAASIARYISDPSTIRARTIDYWGRAPSLEACRNLRSAALAKHDEFRLACEARAREQKDRYQPEDFPCGHERSMENTWHKGDHEQCRACHDAKRAAFVARMKRLSGLLAVPDAEPGAEPARFEDAIPLDLNTSQRVLLLTSMLTGEKVEAITSRSRSKRLVHARWAVIHTLRQTMGWSLPRIGAVVNLSDHTTVRYAAAQAVDLIARDPAFAAICARLADFAEVASPKVSAETVDLLMREDA